MHDPLVSLDGVSVAFGRRKLEVLNAVSFDAAPGEIVGVVGESGSGKSVTALAIMRLLGAQGAVTAGHVHFEGRDLLSLDDDAMRALRGSRLAMIFQEPMTSLNPLFTVGFQVCEVLRGHLGLSAADARAKAVALFDEVGIPEPERRFDEYPHVLSGGMRQRVMIAMAIACQPRLLIADEPTTALDVTIQAQILELMLALRERHRSSILLITHDMGVIARMADRVVVMYAGQVAEVAPLRALFEGPAHPYAKLLLGAMPSARRKLASLPVIPGAMPSPAALPGGCRFHPRCPYAVAQCRTEPPPMTAIAPGRAARCWRAGEVLHGLAA